MKSYLPPPGWKETPKGLTKTWTAPDFKSLWPFMETIAQLAEEQNHHPDWCNSYNRLEVHLCSHDAGGSITEKDFRLAQAIETEAKRFPHLKC